MTTFAANMEISKLLEFTDRAQLREWLKANHATAKECWVTMYRTKSPRTDCIPYLHVVEEALCFGWIDSTVKRLPDGRCAQRLSPRRKNSHWTELNKQRCAELEQRGLMTEAGRKAVPIGLEKQKKRPNSSLLCCSNNRALAAKNQDSRISEK